MLRFQSLSEEVEWSDEEDSDEKYLVKQQSLASEDESLDSFQVNDERNEFAELSVIGIDRLTDHKRSRYSGSIKVNKQIQGPLLQNSAISNVIADYPSVPQSVELTLGVNMLNILWKEFVRLGADEAEMILVEEARKLSDYTGIVELPIESIAALQRMEAKDYIDFSTLMTDIAKVYKPHLRYCTSHHTTDICRVCCSMQACRHSLPSNPVNPASAAACTNTRSIAAAPDGLPATEGKDSVTELPQFQFVGSEEHRLAVIYSDIKHQLNGKVRIKHIAEVMQRLLIPFDTKRLPRSFWTNRGELLIGSVTELKDLIAQLRTDQEQEADPLAAMFKYELPQWLREEFKASEIMLYEHHFALMDKDGGGSIDAEELQALVTSFGSSISREDAQSLLDEYDMDGGGTIDFVEFMVLIYKIQRGTIDLASSDLAQALVEAKAQLQIFEEIEEVSRAPPAGCSVAHFGGSPVECNFHITGPLDSPYEGLRVTLRMTFHDGYPFRQPDVVLLGRVMGLHVLPALGGDARLMHIKQLWSAEWSMRRLLAHVVDLLGRPDPQLLPDHLYEIYASWEAALPAARARLWNTAAEQLHREREAEAKVLDSGVDGAMANNGDGSTRTSSSNRGSKSGTPVQTARTESKASGGADSARGAGSASAKQEPSVCKQEEKVLVDVDSLPREALVAVSEEAVRARVGQLERALGMDALSDEATRRRVLTLSRIEQMHLSTMLLHLLDPPLYRSTVANFMRMHFKSAV